MHFTQPQVKEILSEMLKQKDGFNQILKLSLEALMKSERSLHNSSENDLSNGFRPRRVFGDKQMIELQVPRTRNGQFYPVILSILKSQEEEARRIAYYLYKSGLTTVQVGDVFGEIYGKHYSSSQVSRMFDTAREEIKQWLTRPLEPYYPIVYIDATFIPTRRVDSVSKEAYYVVLGVKADRTREVLGIYNFPTEGASGWDFIFEDLKLRGIQKINLFVSDSLKGIENSIFKHFSQADIQLCVIHFFRNLIKEIRPKHKSEFSDDFKNVFRTDDRNDSKSAAMGRFEKLCLKWGKYYPSIKKRLENERLEYYFTYLEYDYRIRNMIYTTNWIERLNRDFKRTTRMRGALPSVDATLLLLGGVAIDKKCYQRKIGKLNYEQDKFDWED